MDGCGEGKSADRECTPATCFTYSILADLLEVARGYNSLAGSRITTISIDRAMSIDGPLHDITNLNSRERKTTSDATIGHTIVVKTSYIIVLNYHCLWLSGRDYVIPYIDFADLESPEECVNGHSVYISLEHPDTLQRLRSFIARVAALESHKASQYPSLNHVSAAEALRRIAETSHTELEV